MADDKTLLYTQLTARGLVDTKRDFPKEILENEEVLAQIAGIFNTYEKGLTALIQARIHEIKEELVMKATPAEVIVLRQCMLEVAQIFDDCKKYKIEYGKREAGKGNQPPEEPAPPQADNVAPATKDSGDERKLE